MESRIASCEDSGPCTPGPVPSSSPRGPSPMIGAVCALAVIGALVMSVAGVYERDRGDRSADILIERGAARPG